ncbi:hypothetical protein AMTRI_Chr01g132450 [Amborella trichopoda]|uniref:O-fucosyltransferase family protein n=1 Tax=Amborella trichopoda TaxID=13333 RepID=W1NNV9_AMBTC|nr:uncharacterized protein At1g04910 isoform X2 [Amborella trichopoda]ERM97661.1 hypothetical protein AMTR_s00130p00081820 [Amborella trichopoda]|eukprot:XP_011629372.2 uncharacterized protein At1g04910 isoform X2 [Amborella trichopoda]
MKGYQVRQPDSLMGYDVFPERQTFFGTSKGLPSIGKRQTLFRKHVRLMTCAIGLLVLLFLLDSLMLSLIQQKNLLKGVHEKSLNVIQGERTEFVKAQKAPRVMFEGLLHLASHALAENELKNNLRKPWEEPYSKAAAWKPCADQNKPRNQGSATKSYGFIMVSANGGLNQQRVAVCNAVAVASLLNATLVLPKFLYSNVWKDDSQFGDIYQEEAFIEFLPKDLNIVKELPPRLQSLDLEAIGSLITDLDIMKESKPSYFVKAILPLLIQNEVVHFVGFGNRLAFDPLPFDLQRLRCKCNFHALKFVPKIQEAGALLVQRIRKFSARLNPLDEQLIGSYMHGVPLEEKEASLSQPRYLALHLRFEMDMVAYSLCEFGGGENEKKELQAYRETHFPALVMRTRNSQVASSEDLRKLGRCPLTPEEAALMLVALGVKRSTRIYLAGSQIYGGHSRMVALTSLFPNVVTKEDLLTPTELAPFRNFSSQMAALDFIACATADVFAMTDSGSQLSSLVSGYRTYFGGRKMPSIRPNKKRLARILSESGSIEWVDFEERVRKMIEECQRVGVRPVGRSIYRQPRSPECMCKA